MEQMRKQYEGCEHVDHSKMSKRSPKSMFAHEGKRGQSRTKGKKKMSRMAY